MLLPGVDRATILLSYRYADKTVYGVLDLVVFRSNRDSICANPYH